MNIIVCVKAVPYINGPVEVRDDRKDIVKSNMNFKINDTDDNALEEALRLKEKFGGKVTVITVSESTYEEKVRQVLWECMAKGADEVIHLVDESFAELDSFATAKLLSEIVRKIPFDLILTGSQASDDNLGHVGPMLAEFLGLPYATLVVKVDVDITNKRIIAWMEQDEGFKELVELELPALLAVQSGINEPRYASLSKIRLARTRSITRVSAKDANMDYEVINNIRKFSIMELLPVEGKRTEFLKGAKEEVVLKLARLIAEIIRG
jgi:electron transfer flavoprotein beta subunit